MENEHSSDWDPASGEFAKDQRAAYDKLRRKSPVAHNKFFGWTLFRHAEVMRALVEHENFGNAVSQHLSVPNGMDPPEHTDYRKIIEPYFSKSRMEAFDPVCRGVVEQVFQEHLRNGELEFMSEIALPFAVRVQCAFLGWPESIHERLIDWIQRSQRATLAKNREMLSAVAREFEGIIDHLVDERRRDNAPPERDITSSLMHEKVHGRPLSNEELASILRNWTAGEIGTISAAAGIIAGHLASDEALQTKLRSDGSLIPYAIDEILRVHGPLVSNRRVTKCPVDIGGTKIAAGERITINWVSANRDEEVFEEADQFRFGRDETKNLLYGAGIHVCPGAPLARLEMQIFTGELLSRASIGTSSEVPTPALYPASGFSILKLRMNLR